MDKDEFKKRIKKVKKMEKDRERWKYLAHPRTRNRAVSQIVGGVLGLVFHFIALKNTGKKSR